MRVRVWICVFLRIGIAAFRVFLKKQIRNIITQNQHYSPKKEALSIKTQIALLIFLTLTNQKTKNMEINFLALVLAALSTLVVGFIWYNPKVFGTIWMKEAGMTEEKMKGANMFVIFGMAIVYAFFISFILQILTIHQYGALGMVGGDPSLAKPSYHAFMADYGDAFRTFKHGMLHGFISGLFFALPVVGTGALFERRSWRYTLIAGGFWVISCMIMGGIVCAMK